MASYRVVVHGFPTRENARKVAGVFAMQTAAAQVAGDPSASALTFSVEPDDPATAEVDPTIDSIRGEGVRVIDWGTPPGSTGSN